MEVEKSINYGVDIQDLYSVPRSNARCLLVSDEPPRIVASGLASISAVQFPVPAKEYGGLGGRPDAEKRAKKGDHRMNPSCTHPSRTEGERLLGVQYSA